jgi:hypothetical protein
MSHAAATASRRRLADSAASRREVRVDPRTAPRGAPNYAAYAALRTFCVRRSVRSPAVAGVRFAPVRIARSGANEVRVEVHTSLHPYSLVQTGGSNPTGRTSSFDRTPEARFVTTGEAGHEHIEDYPLPGYDDATNQQAELAAVVEALKAIVVRRAIEAKPHRRIVIWTDSTYLTNGYDSARFSWQRNGWKRGEGNPCGGSSASPAGAAR